MSLAASTFAISDLAREFGITPRTIRFWEDQGILSPEREGSKRIFARRDRARLKMALRGKRLGLSLAEIKDLNACASWKSAERPWSSNVKTSKPCWPKSRSSSIFVSRNWLAETPNNFLSSS